mmetsp:Transcript_28484/g.43835  ORF Transcript_28484/g.43835 Transcript_28484/m.43835 type:complete len:235 (-) Transcript_28484:179-883(-)
MHVQPQPSFYTLPRLVENLDKIDSERLNEDRRGGAAHGDGERRARQVAGRERQGVGLVADRAEAAKDSARSHRSRLRDHAVVLDKAVDCEGVLRVDDCGQVLSAHAGLVTRPVKHVAKPLAGIDNAHVGIEDKGGHHRRRAHEVAVERLLLLLSWAALALLVFEHLNRLLKDLIHSRLGGGHTRQHISQGLDLAHAFGAAVSLSGEVFRDVTSAPLSDRRQALEVSIGRRLVVV